MNASYVAPAQLLAVSTMLQKELVNIMYKCSNNIRITCIVQ